MKKRPPANEGVIVTGRATVSIENATVGRNARSVTVITPHIARALAEKGLTDVDMRLRALEKVLSEDGRDLQGIEELRRGARSAAEELAKPTPNRPKVLAILGQIAEAAKSVSGIKIAIDALRAVIGGLL